MRKLLNTLYITKADSILSLENENVVVKANNEIVMKAPLLNLESIICFNYFGATSTLMGECAKRSITLSFLNEYGKFIGSLYGESKGNVLLRKEQYRISDNKEKSLMYAKSFVFGKLFNQKWVLERARRDHALRINEASLKTAIEQISNNLNEVLDCTNIDSLRALEGNSARGYFGVFDELILQNKADFCFVNRNRRPPLDRVNAMLSFAYSLLALDCRHALEAVGLDSFVGFMHTDRSGRPSLALDLMEELRPQFADRFVLSCINRREFEKDDFVTQESGAVIFNDSARKKFLMGWQQRKRETITHPFLKEKIEWGLVPHVQALLLARALRGDIEKYPAFLWK